MNKIIKWFKEAKLSKKGKDFLATSLEVGVSIVYPVISPLIPYLKKLSGKWKWMKNKK